MIGVNMAGCKKSKLDSKHVYNKDGEIVEPNIMNLQKEHKKWYLRQDLGKQRGKPHAVPPNIKKTGKTWKKKK